MTMADDPRKHSPFPTDETVGAEPPAAGVLPQSERDHDEQRVDYMRSLEDQPAHPLTEAEKEAARSDPGVSERVYAPASERVPKEPVPGHEEVVGDVDPNTPERRATGWREPAGATSWREPAGTPTGPATPTSYDTSYLWNNPTSERDWKLPLAAVGAAALVGAVGGWLYYQRWQRERNRPINRMRRQARQVVYVVSDRLPSRDEIVERLPSPEQARPAGGASILAVALAILASRLLQRRSGREEMMEQTRSRLPDTSEKWVNLLRASADRVRSRAADVASTAQEKAGDRAEDVSPDGHFRLPPFRR